MQLQDLATSLLELWNLMDTPMEEQQMFHKVTCNLVASEDEITEPDMLSVDYINYVSSFVSAWSIDHIEFMLNCCHCFIFQVTEEVCRLEELKVSKMKELVLKKKGELETVCRTTHLNLETDSAMNVAMNAIESGFYFYHSRWSFSSFSVSSCILILFLWLIKGAVDAACVLEQIGLQIATVKEEALSRKEILEKVEKWMAACEEEHWLEEYNRVCSYTYALIFGLLWT